MSASKTTAKTKALFVEDELSKEFFKWLLYDRTDIDYIVCNGQRCATQIASQYTNYTKNVVLKDRDYRGDFQAIATTSTLEIVSVAGSTIEYTLRVTEIENIYAFILQSIDANMFNQVFSQPNIVSYISETQKRVCFSLLVSEFWGSKCPQTNNTDCICNINKTSDYSSAVTFLNSNSSDINLMLAVLAGKELLKIYETIGRFNVIGYINKKLGIGSLSANPSAYIETIPILQQLYNDINGVLA